MLVDGSAARPPPVALEGVGTVVATRTRMIDAATDHGLRTCAAQFGRHPAGRVVERIGVQGASVTLVDPARREAYACDRLGEAWCGWASGRSRAQRVDGPRLSLSCLTSAGTSVGFAWILAGPGTRYLVVEQRGLAESYSSVEHLPIRVTSTDTDLESTTARFRLREHGSDGRLLRTYVVEARVAG
jgi:hypothetical protein